MAALDGERQSALEALAIIQAVTGIGRAFGMTVVAEGIETESRHRHLKACGVHALQGYLFGRPMPMRAFTDLLTARSDASPDAAAALSSLADECPRFPLSSGPFSKIDGRDWDSASAITNKLPTALNVALASNVVLALVPDID